MTNYIKYAGADSIPSPDQSAWWNPLGTTFWNGIGTGISKLGTGFSNIGQGFGKVLGMNFNSNLGNNVDYARNILGYDDAQMAELYKNPDAWTKVEELRLNALNTQTAQNQQALAPWGLGLSALGAGLNWWNAKSNTELARKALSQQWSLARANFNNMADTLDEARRDRAGNRSAFSGGTYSAPTPLARV